MHLLQDWHFQHAPGSVMKKPRFLRGIHNCGGWGFAQPPQLWFSSPGKGFLHHPARGPAGNLARRVPVGQSVRFWPSLGHPVPRSCVVRGALTGAIPRLWSGRRFPATPLGPDGSGQAEERRAIAPGAQKRAHRGAASSGQPSQVSSKVMVTAPSSARYSILRLRREVPKRPV